MYSTSIQRRLFGETLEIIRAALHGEPATTDDTGVALDLPATAPAGRAGSGDEASASGTSGSGTSGSGTSGSAATAAPVPAGRAAAAFFRSAAWDAPRAATTTADGAPSDPAAANEPTGDPEPAPAVAGANGRRNVRAVLAAAAWDRGRSSARVIPLDRESAREEPADRDADAEAFQRAATESALAAARGGRDS
jgi:hypothetical protein